ncbi:histidinol dehydrogenase [Nakamurella leprariae]|uniref:Histidinol dehydrogenase n=1 Tax=Nakamurella leprariae TaxID=2803911 RepID=A0A938YC57_9ACTN|nr:histidinol dehydrogenase [Nakamurella leprariae]MBM9466896.1 histidinol dehydrogenase [Nakamurella leprariae]
MLQRIDLRGGLGNVRALLPRAGVDVTTALSTVEPLVADVRERGATAVLDAAERFDGVRPERLRVPTEVIASAEATMDPAVRAALTESIARARIGHAAQLPTEQVTTVVPGGVVRQRWIPVRRVGLYVPGGLALYPSSVVMNVVPAQVAGVEAIAITSPPQRSNAGWPDPNVLAACALLGVDEVYAAGGAQGIALLALGALDVDGGVIEPVDVITGPGNVYVTAAKRLLRGTVAIDSEAGPTEIAVVADDSADAEHVAADLVSQAEHDPLAASVLITDSPALADAVDAALPARVDATKHSERVRTALSGRQSGTVLVASIDDAITVADAYAAEHLEIQTRDAGAVAARICNAGAIFVGAFSPVSLGDYCAGSNHVLPTSGTARYSAGLSTATFLRPVQVIDYTRAALDEVRPHVLALAQAEDLPAHGEAVSARFPEGGAR